MKIIATFKCPDALYMAITSAGIQPNTDEWDDVYNTLSKWTTYGEYVNIEFDTEAETATVLYKK